MKTLNIAILISGRGSNMCALIKSLHSHPTANFCCVISDNPDAEGIDKANRLNVPTHVVNRKKCANKKQFEERLLHYLEHHRIELILLAGFMSVLSAHFVARYTKKIINIHPSLLPKYRGLNTHQRALDNGDKVTGATVHWVNEEIDAGQTIKQCSMDIYPHDKAEQIAQRLLPLENGLHVEVVQDLLDQN